MINLLLNNIDSIVSDYEIKGFVISNISGFELLKKYIGNEKYTFIANYTMNIFNEYSIQELQSLGINVVTPSVELNKFISNLVLFSKIFRQTKNFVKWKFVVWKFYCKFVL